MDIGLYRSEKSGSFLVIAPMREPVVVAVKDGVLLTTEIPRSMGLLLKRLYVEGREIAGAEKVGFEDLPHQILVGVTKEIADWNTALAETLVGSDEETRHARWWKEQLDLLCCAVEDGGHIHLRGGPITLVAFRESDVKAGKVKPRRGFEVGHPLQDFTEEGGVEQ